MSDSIDKAEDIMRRLTPFAMARCYEDGVVIHGPDAPSRAFFWIESGAVRFDNVTSDGDLIEIFTLQAGESFGEISIYSSTPPPHFARTVGETRLSRIEGAVLRDAVAADRTLQDWFFHRFAMRLQHTYLLLDEVRRRHPEERIFRHLAWLALNGFGIEGGPAVAITQEELAGRLGLSRSTVCDALKKLRERGKVKTEYRRITVVFD